MSSSLVKVEVWSNEMIFLRVNSSLPSNFQAIKMQAIASLVSCPLPMLSASLAPFFACKYLSLMASAKYTISRGRSLKCFLNSKKALMHSFLMISKEFLF